MQVQATVKRMNGVGSITLSTDRDRPGVVRLTLPEGSIDLDQSDLSEAIERVRQFPPFDPTDALQGVMPRRPLR